MDGRGGGGVGGGCGGDEVRVAGGGEGEGGALEAGEVRGFGAEDGVDVGVDFELGEGCGCCWGEVRSWRRGSGERDESRTWFGHLRRRWAVFRGVILRRVRCCPRILVVADQTSREDREGRLHDSIVVKDEGGDKQEAQGRLHRKPYSSPRAERGRECHGQVAGTGHGARRRSGEGNYEKKSRWRSSGCGPRCSRGMARWPVSWSIDGGDRNKEEKVERRGPTIVAVESWSFCRLSTVPPCWYPP